VFGLVFGLVFGVVGGFTTSEAWDRVRSESNQGIRQAARGAAVAGVGGGLLFGLAGLLIGLGADQDLGLALALGLGPLFGLAAGLALGGYACLSHAALRLVLWRSGALPLDCGRFLDAAAERVLLRKVGGGYLFVHRLLQEHFASL